jgi:hypothetical protein
MKGVRMIAAHGGVHEKQKVNAPPQMPPPHSSRTRCFRDVYARAAIAVVVGAAVLTCALRGLNIVV